MNIDFPVILLMVIGSMMVILWQRKRKQQPVKEVKTALQIAQDIKKAEEDKMLQEKNDALEQQKANRPLYEAGHAFIAKELKPFDGIGRLTYEFNEEKRQHRLMCTVPYTGEKWIVLYAHPIVFNGKLELYYKFPSQNKHYHGPCGTVSFETFTKKVGEEMAIRL